MSTYQDKFESFITVDPDAAALGAIFFEDGMTYLRLGDLVTACEMLARSVETDPTRGLYFAYYAYSVYRRDLAGRNPDSSYVNLLKTQTRMVLQEAVQISPEDADVYLIVARFHIKCAEVREAEEALVISRRISPQNPNLANVEKSLRVLKSKMNVS